jgi:glycosyltransferase domain-containing protein
MNPEHELTVLLALKDRAAFTWRWMSYADHVRFPFAVFLADGGSDDTVKRGLADRTVFPHVHYQYVRYPPDRSYTDYWSKIADALSRVRTPFVALADNDDLFVVSSVRDAVVFLRGYLARCQAPGCDGSRVLRPIP